MKCVNCGAELNNGVCEYCGTDYHKNNHISGTIDKYEGYITIGGKELHVYLGGIEVNTDTAECLSYDGDFKRVITTGVRRTLTLIEF